VLEECIRVWGYFGHCHNSQSLYNNMCEVGYISSTSLLYDRTRIIWLLNRAHLCEFSLIYIEEYKRV